MSVHVCLDLALGTASVCRANVVGGRSESPSLALKQLLEAWSKWAESVVLWAAGVAAGHRATAVLGCSRSLVGATEAARLAASGLVGPEHVPA